MASKWVERKILIKVHSCSDCYSQTREIKAALAQFESSGGRQTAAEHLTTDLEGRVHRSDLA